jgi:hypothetical protein
MFHVVPIELDSPTDPARRPAPDLLVRLAAQGVRLLDHRRYLLLEAPPEVLAGDEWPALEAAAGRSGAALQNLAVLVAMARTDTRPYELVERMLALPSECFPVLIEALGGPERIPRLARDLGSEAQLDLCFAAYLQALAHQVANNLGDDEEDEPEGDGGPSEVPAELLLGAESAGDGAAAC